MNKTDFVKNVAAKTGYSQKDIKTVLEAMQEVTYATMANEEEVKMFDGLTLAGVHKEATTARNPMTGATIDVPAKTVPKCRFGKAAKDAVNTK